MEGIGVRICGWEGGRRGEGRGEGEGKRKGVLGREEEEEEKV